MKKILWALFVCLGATGFGADEFLGTLSGKIFAGVGPSDSIVLQPGVFTDCKRTSIGALKSFCDLKGTGKISAVTGESDLTLTKVTTWVEKVNETTNIDTYQMAGYWKETSAESPRGSKVTIVIKGTEVNGKLGKIKGSINFVDFGVTNGLLLN